MIYWLADQRGQLIQYVIEILVNGVLLWAILNLLVRPRWVLEESQSTLDDAPQAKPRLCRHWPYPFFKCQLCALLLFLVALFVMVAPLAMNSQGGGRSVVGILVFLIFWFFASRWAAWFVFEGSRGQATVIFILYTVISYLVESMIRWTV